MKQRTPKRRKPRQDRLPKTAAVTSHRIAPEHASDTVAYWTDARMKAAEPLPFAVEPPEVEEFDGHGGGKPGK
jgi:hypothetical protein